MKIKTVLHSCKVSYIDIVLRHFTEQIDIEIRNRKDFYNFIETYGDSDVYDWTIESVEGVPYLIFDLKRLCINVKN
jgi:hypothetical protein